MADTSRDWMFCPHTGALLDLDPLSGIASCKESKYSINVAALQSTKKTSSSDMQAFRIKYGLESLAAGREEQDDLAATARATVDEKCPKCGNDGLEFYTMQLRSADEGQTVFYECPKCRYKYSQNT